MPTIGEPFPDFSLPNQDGDMVNLADLRGKKVVLFAYPKAATPGCTTQACGFRDEYPRIESDEAVVLGLSPDPIDALKDWQAAENLPYGLLSDPDHQVLEQLGAWGEKSMYGKPYMGVIRSHWVIGADGTLLDEQIKISPKDSVKKALKVLQEA